MTKSITCPIIGLVGGVGSGKSSLAKSLAKQTGAVIVDGDAIGHDVLEFQGIQAQLKERFGNAIFNDNGHVIRAKLASRVFGSSSDHAQALRDLEAITHPAIREQLNQKIHSTRSQHSPFVILDAAILLEAGWRELCDYVLFIDTKATQRLERVKERGWTREQWQRREASQMDLQEKQRLADATIDNTGLIDDALNQVLRVLDSLGVQSGESKNTPQSSYETQAN